MRRSRSKPGLRRKAAKARQRRAGTGLSNRLEAYFALQAETFTQSFNRLRQTPVASSLTILVIAIALVLPASLHALADNARKAIAGLETTSRISLFLKPELPNETGRKLADRLTRHPRIAAAELITKEAGLAELKAHSGFGDALDALDFNPLPVVIGISPRDTLTDAASLDQLLTELRRLPEADFAQFDTEWIEKLKALLAIAERLILVFGVLLGCGVLVIIGNTIRLELQNRREEIAVARLMGATDGFICRPFLYAGAWYGVLGSGLAWLLANGLILLVRGPATRLAELYGSPYRLAFLSFSASELLIGGSVLVGMCGAYGVVWYHLRKLAPR